MQQVRRILRRLGDRSLDFPVDCGQVQFPPPLGPYCRALETVLLDAPNFILRISFLEGIVRRMRIHDGLYDFCSAKLHC